MIQMVVRSRLGHGGGPCFATSTLRFFPLLPWYSKTACDGPMQLPRGLLAPTTTERGQDLQMLALAASGVCQLADLGGTDPWMKRVVSSDKTPPTVTQPRPYPL